jgi:protein-S-isoprenylcysteine O-methyltransferase Ste14
MIDPVWRGRWLIPPPLLFLAVFAAGYVLNRLIPIGGEVQTPTRSLVLAGYVLIGLAVALGLWCVGFFIRSRTTVIPHGTPSSLIQRGPYSFTRNPIYLAMILAYLGGTAVVAAAWCIPLLLIPLLYVEDRVIPHEEAALTRQFGQEYLDYRHRVRRWL